MLGPDPREFGQEPGNHFVGDAGALRRLLKVGMLELLLVALESRGQFLGIGRIDQRRGDQVVSRG